MEPHDPLAPYYHDPLHDMLDAVENSVERWRDPLALSPPLPEVEKDPLWLQLSALEAQIEGTIIHPAPPVPGFEPPGPPPIEPVRMQPPSPGPPLPEEGRIVDAVELRAPGAARPFFTPEGLSRDSYRPHPGSNPGRLGGTSIPSRWCPELNEAIEPTRCSACEQWGDHGSGIEECRHDWQERNQEKKPEDREAEE